MNSITLKKLCDGIKAVDIPSIEKHIKDATYNIQIYKERIQAIKNELKGATKEAKRCEEKLTAEKELLEKVIKNPPVVDKSYHLALYNQIKSRFQSIKMEETKVVAVTNPIILRDRQSGSNHLIGRLRIQIGKDIRNDREIRCTNIDFKTRGMNHHPHVMEAGYLCLGLPTTIEQVNELLARRSYIELLAFLVDFLNQYYGETQHSPRRWLKVSDKVIRTGARVKFDYNGLQAVGVVIDIDDDETIVATLAEGAWLISDRTDIKFCDRKWAEKEANRLGYSRGWRVPTKYLEVIE